MDRNQLIGMSLLSILLLAYFYFAPKPPEQLTDTTLHQDSVAQVVEQETQLIKEELFQNLTDSALLAEQGAFAAGMRGDEQAIVLENEDVKITFSTKGASIQEVELKKYTTADKQPLILFDAESSQMKWEIQTNTPAGKVDLQKLFYQVSQKSDKSVTFQLQLPTGKVFTQSYTLADDGYILNYDLNAEALRNYLISPNVEVNWTNKLKKIEQTLALSRRYSTINYYEVEEGFDQITKESTSLERKEVENPVRWVSMQHRFFNAAFITDAQFENMTVQSAVNEQDTTSVKDLWAGFQIPIEKLNKDANLRYFFGPNEYHILSDENIAPDFDQNIYMGWSVFRPISRWVIIPLFDLLESWISNYGLIVLILVLIVRTALSPLTYKSYTSSSKMKVLQPALAELKKKHGDDQQKYAADQMKLFRDFGVNPLSGCLPMVLQMPIFISLFFFFPSAIHLRGESFLWATDLATYDSILTLPFNIPFYGSHVSLFTLLMAVSQIAMTQLTPQAGTGANMPSNMPINPKTLMYIMPVFFLFFFNGYPAALTLYYFGSNTIAVVQSLVIRKYFVDEKKILAKLEKNKARREAKGNNGKKGGMMQRLQKLQEEAKKAQEESQAKRENNTKARLRKSEEKKKKK